MPMFGDVQSFTTDAGREVYGDTMTVHVGSGVYLNLKDEDLDISITTTGQTQ